MIKIVNYQRENVKTTPLRRQRIQETKYLKEAPDCSKGLKCHSKFKNFPREALRAPLWRGGGHPLPYPPPASPLPIQKPYGLLVPAAYYKIYLSFENSSYNLSEVRPPQACETKLILPWGVIPTRISTVLCTWCLYNENVFARVKRFVGFLMKSSKQPVITVVLFPNENWKHWGIVYIKLSLSGQ